MSSKDSEKTIYIAAAVIALAASLLYFAIQNISLQTLQEKPGLGFLQFFLPVVYAVFFSWGSLLLLSEKGDPDRTLIWLLLLFAFPIVGFLIYQLLGRQALRTRRLRRRLAQARLLSPPAAEKKAGSGDAPPADFPAQSRLQRMSRLVKAGSGFSLTLENQVTILNNGAEIFSSMLAEMSRARRHIHLETYIFRDDDIGRRFFGILAEKAAKGVEIRVIVDGMGCCISRRRIRELRSQGVDLHLFAPVPFTLLHSNINFRNHRKLLIIDGQSAYVGGANIGDDYLGLYPDVGFWRDVQLKIQGPAVHYLQQVFLRDWVFAAGDQAIRRPEGLPDFLAGLYPSFSGSSAGPAPAEPGPGAGTAFAGAGEPAVSLAVPAQTVSAQAGSAPEESSPAPAESKPVPAQTAPAQAASAALAEAAPPRRPLTGIPVQITAGGPGSPWETIMQAYHYAISTARSTINITSPYFIPSESIATALKTASLAGIRVRLLLPKNPDHRLVYLAAMPYLDQLLKAGAEIWLYDNGFIHSKVVVVDGEIAIVGTANMDQRSFGLNFEINAILYDNAAASALNADFEEDLTLSIPIKKEEFLSRPMSRRLLESFCRLLSPIL